MYIIFSDIWALGCVLYELATLKHAVSHTQHTHTHTHNIHAVKAKRNKGMKNAGHGLNPGRRYWCHARLPGRHFSSLCFSLLSLHICTRTHGFSFKYTYSRGGMMQHTALLRLVQLVHYSISVFYSCIKHTDTNGHY